MKVRLKRTYEAFEWNPENIELVNQISQSLTDRGQPHRIENNVLTIFSGSKYCYTTETANAGDFVVKNDLDWLHTMSKESFYRDYEAV